MEAPTIRVEVETVGSFEASMTPAAGGSRSSSSPTRRWPPGTRTTRSWSTCIGITRAIAWALSRGAGSEESFQWGRVRLEGGEAARFVLAAVYEAKTRRWIPGSLSIVPPRLTHAVPAGSAEDVAALFGLPLWRRGELLARFGLKEIFPDAVDPAKAQPAFTVIVRPDGAEARR
jgi:hypothetical protein